MLLAHPALSCAYIQTAKCFVDMWEIGVYLILVSQVPKSHKQVSAHWFCWFMLSSTMPPLGPPHQKNEGKEEAVDKILSLFFY